MPASDASVTFARQPINVLVTPFGQNSNTAITANRAQYTPFTAPVAGAIGSATMNVQTAATGNFKCAIYSSGAGLPVTPLGSATPISAPGVGNAVFTFGTPVPVTAGTQYFIAFDSDATSGFYGIVTSPTSGCFWTSATYSAFPTSSPPVTTGASPVSITITITPSPSANYSAVYDAQQDALATYVYDSNPGDADFYSVASIASTPTVVVATTIRAYALKSDAGTRTLAVQLKSGATVVASPTITLTTSGFLWTWRTDLTDPATGAAWTAVGVNNATIGPKVIA